MTLDDYEIAQVPPELLRVLAAISSEDRKTPLPLSELAERAKVPGWMMRNALRTGVARGIIRVRGRGRNRRYLIEIISPRWLRYVTAATRGGHLPTSA